MGTGRLPINQFFIAKITMRSLVFRITSLGVVATTTALSILFAASTDAAPFVPASDGEVLERLSARLGESGSQSQANRSMRALLARDPENVDLAVRIAQRYVSLARTESDPRFLGQAQATLARWWSLAEPPVPVLLLRATIRQSNHDFAGAKADLERALKRQPNLAQAWLTLATVQQVSGDYPAARSSCAKLVPLTTPLISITCTAGVDGVTGQAIAAYAALDEAVAEASRASASGSATSASLLAWATTLQAEIAERLGRTQAADKLYRRSLALDATDAYTLAAYADFLLDGGRASEVLPLIASTTRIDNLLLRRAIAAKLTGAADAAQTAHELTLRFAAASARRDRVHQREEARYTLIFKADPAAALALAEANWKVQKEPLDARIALEAAVAAKRPRAAQDVLAWLASTQLQSEKLSQLAAVARAL